LAYKEAKHTRFTLRRAYTNICSTIVSETIGLNHCMCGRVSLMSVLLLLTTVEMFYYHSARA